VRKRENQLKIIMEEGVGEGVTRRGNKRENRKNSRRVRGRLRKKGNTQKKYWHRERKSEKK
jgi:hypothetical protein